MNEHIVTLLRTTRKLGQVYAEPLDWVVRRLLNDKKNFPPLHLRQLVGGLNDFEGSAGEYTAYLKLLCGLKPGDDLLDLGCGCGLMTLNVTGGLSLPEYLNPGRYVGLDTNGRLIDHCNGTNRDPNTSFIYLRHVVKGRLPGASNSYNVVLAKSLFTHLFRHEVEDYLEEIKRLLKPGGRCLSTWFLLGEEKPKGKLTFQHYEGDFSLERHTKPRLAVAYNQDYLQELLEDTLDLRDVDIKYGTWTGNQNGLSFQDIVIFRKG